MFPLLDTPTGSGHKQGFVVSTILMTEADVFFFFLQKMEIHLHDGSILEGRVTMVSGKISKIALINKETITAKDINHIVTTGKDSPSASDSARYRLLINAIQNPKELFQSPFLRLIWYNPDPSTLPWPHPIHPRPEEPFEVDFIYRSLNKSQEAAANAALLINNENRITTLIGPPGSGMDLICDVIS
jgi:hypothetical protein